MSIPNKIRAGDTLKFTESLTDYPASVWTLAYTLINATDNIEFVAVPVGDDYSVNIAHGITSNWNKGYYAYVARVSNGTESYVVLYGDLEILANATSANFEVRSHARIVLDNINAVLEDKATLEQASYSIDGRSLNSRSIDELLKIKEKYEYLVAREKNKKGGYRLNTINWIL